VRPGDVLTVGSTTAIEAFGASSLVSSYRDYVDIRDRSKNVRDRTGNEGRMTERCHGKPPRVEG